MVLEIGDKQAVRIARSTTASATTVRVTTTIICLNKLVVPDAVLRALDIDSVTHPNTHFFFFFQDLFIYLRQREK